MDGGIWLFRSDGSPVEMNPAEYDSEDLLQALFAQHPDLLAGSQMDPSSPRRWLLVRREAPVPAEEGGGGRWSVDHLFLDQDGVPTLVEVKRSTDTRLRREVVGQMLDYAAHAATYWPAGEVRRMFEVRCTDEGQDPGTTLRAFLGDAGNEEAFWAAVKTNLQAGRLRLVFAADVIPAELQRVVEFLNEQMDPTEVLALEIRRYAGQGFQTMIPRVLGQTSEARDRKSAGGATRVWDEPSFLADLSQRRGKDAVHVATALLEWARARGLRLWWGRGLKDGSFFPMLDHAGHPNWTFAVWTYGRVEIQFQNMRGAGPYKDRAARLDLLRRLNAVPGLSIPEDRLDKRPSFDIDRLIDRANRSSFLEVFDAYLAAITASAPQE